MSQAGASVGSDHQQVRAQPSDLPVEDVAYLAAAKDTMEPAFADSTGRRSGRKLALDHAPHLGLVTGRELSLRLSTTKDCLKRWLPGMHEVELATRDEPRRDLERAAGGEGEVRAEDQLGVRASGTLLDQKDWAVAAANHALCRASTKEISEGVGPMCAEDDQTGAHLVGDMQDILVVPTKDHLDRNL